MAFEDVYLHELVPTSGLAAWYPLDNDPVGNNSITDESGVSGDLGSLGLSFPPITADQINGRKAVVGDGTSYADAWQRSVTLSLKDVFIIGKVAASPFGTFPGLFTGILAGSAATLVGNSADTKWLSNAGGSPNYDYYKSGTSYGDTNRLAPFSYFEQMRLKYATGWSQVGLSFGHDREATTRQFNGSWCDVMLYTSVKTDAEAARLKLYSDLKFGLWLLNGTTLTFPSPSITDIYWARFKEQPTDWDGVTVDNTYDDEGKSFNTVTDTPPTFWEIGYTGLSYSQAQIFDAFNNAARRDRTFSMVDKWGVTQTGLRIVRYDRNHREHKSQDHTVSFTLAKYQS